MESSSKRIVLNANLGSESMDHPIKSVAFGGPEVCRRDDAKRFPRVGEALKFLFEQADAADSGG